MDTSYYTKLALDKSSPFFNKATQQTTAPGSTLKLLSAVTGMMEGVIDDDTYFDCTGEFDLITPSIFCWNKQGHGSLEITGAIEQSCNYFFNMVSLLVKIQMEISQKISALPSCRNMLRNLTLIRKPE